MSKLVEPKSFRVRCNNNSLYEENLMVGEVYEARRALADGFLIVTTSTGVEIACSHKRFTFLFDEGPHEGVQISSTPPKPMALHLGVSFASNLPHPPSCSQCYLPLGPDDRWTHNVSEWTGHAYRCTSRLAPQGIMPRVWPSDSAERTKLLAPNAPPPSYSPPPSHALEKLAAEKTVTETLTVPQWRFPFHSGSCRHFEEISKALVADLGDVQRVDREMAKRMQVASTALNQLALTIRIRTERGPKVAKLMRGQKVTDPVINREFVRLVEELANPIVEVKA